MTLPPSHSQLGQDVAHAMNLFAHPLAGWAAASAVGMGLATQAWGLWFGALAGAIETAARSSQEGVYAGERQQTVAALKARAAAVSLMADAQSLAQEVAAAVPAQATAERRPAASKRARGSAAGLPAVKAARPAAAGKPAQPDDLKRLPGIGPKLEQVLNGLGIWSYAQIAGWNDADIGWVEDQLGLSGRVGRDGWVAAAAKLRTETGRKGE